MKFQIYSSNVTVLCKLPSFQIFIILYWTLQRNQFTLEVQGLDLMNSPRSEIDSEFFMFVLAKPSASKNLEYELATIVP